MRSRPIYAMLLMTEAILAFALGVFGNKVADLLKITPALIILGAAAVVSLLYLATLSRLRFEAGESLFPASPGKGLRIFLLNAVLTVFPAGIVVGMFSGITTTLLLPGRRFLTPWHSYLHDYEMLAVLIGCLSVGLAAARKPKRSVILMMSAGFALGLAASIIVLDPRANNSLLTFSGLTATMLTVGFVASSHGYSSWLAVLKAALKPDDHNS